MHHAPHPPLPLRVLVGFLVLVFVACETPGEGEAGIVTSSIERHGGDRFEDSRIRFTFRGTPFEVIRERGRFRYQRSYVDDLGRSVVEVMDNDGSRREIDGVETPLSDAERASLEVAVNSVVYFGFLPFRLRDPAVRLRHLGEQEVVGEPYLKIEVTFEEDGGGEDWEDRFVYWIHRDDRTLDYLAYRYERDGGGTRFRRAVNRREVGGLLVQDYENYRAAMPIEDIADYDRLLEEGAIELVSMVELDDVEVTRAEESLDRELQ